MKASTAPAAAAGALRLEGVIAARAKANQSAGGGAVPQKSAKPVDTRQEIAKAAGVSHDTVAKVPLLERRREILAGMAKERQGERTDLKHDIPANLPERHRKPATQSPPRSEFQAPRPAILSKLLRML